MQDLGRFPHIYIYSCGNQYAGDALAERKTVVSTFRLKKKKSQTSRKIMRRVVTGALFQRITKSVGMSMYRAENTFEIKMKKS